MVVFLDKLRLFIQKVGTDVRAIKSGKWDRISSGTNITISGNKISKTNTTYLVGTTINSASISDMVWKGLTIKSYLDNTATTFNGERGYGRFVMNNSGSLITVDAGITKELFLQKASFDTLGFSRPLSSGLGLYIALPTRGMYQITFSCQIRELRRYLRPAILVKKGNVIIGRHDIEYNERNYTLKSLVMITCGVVDGNTGEVIKVEISESRGSSSRQMKYNECILTINKMM